MHIIIIGRHHEGEIMDTIANYVKPELLVVSVVLYWIGLGLKHTQFIRDKYIPLILGICGIAFCGVYVWSSCQCSSGKEIAMAVFTAVTQGILVAGLSTYVNQIIKQAGKRE